MKKVRQYLLILLMGSSWMHAQPSDLQWLLLALENSEPDTHRVNLLVHISKELMNSQVKEAMSYAEDGLKLSEKLTYEDGIGKTQILIGEAHLIQNHPRRGIRNLENALPWVEQSQDTVLLMYVYQQLALGHGMREDEVEAALYTEKHENLQQHLLNTETQARIQVLEQQFEAEKDAASLARLQALKAETVRDSALNLISQQEAILLKQNLELEELEHAATQLAHERTKAQLALEREQKLMNLITMVLILLLSLILGGFFFFKSRQAKKEAIRERMEAERLRQLTAGIAHEIKNPLNFVNNFAQGSQELAEELIEELDRYSEKIEIDDLENIQDILQDIKQNVADILKNGQRVDSIVNNMTSHAKQTQRKFVLSNIHKIIEEQIARACEHHFMHDQTFKPSIEKFWGGGIPPISLIPLDIERVILNLLNNACDAMKQREHLEGKSYKPKVSLNTELGNNEVIIRITDNGTGISPEQIDRIFHPFFTTKPTGKGNAGLGLSLSKEIIEKGHSGKLEVHSELGQFTEFAIHLPIDPMNQENELVVEVN